MNLQFTHSEAELAQSFADKANLQQTGPVTIGSLETDNDTLEVGVFCITRVLDTQVTNSILGEQSREAVAYVVSTELQEYSSDTGYSSDVAEITREWSLHEALKACAHAELEWRLESIEYGLTKDDSWG